MAVFFVHDPARGIVTPLDKRFQQRGDIPPTSALTKTNAVHEKFSQPNPQESPMGRQHRAAKAAYAKTLQHRPHSLGKVSDVMSEPVITLPLDATLQEAWVLMQRHEIRHIVIVDEKQDLCGMLSAHLLLPDLMERVLHDTASRDQDAQTAEANTASITMRDYCGHRVLSTSPETELLALGEAMLEQGLDGIPVTENGRLVGVVTDSDILKVVLKSRPLHTEA